VKNAQQKQKYHIYLKKILESKVTNGQYIRSMDRQPISKEDKFLWLSREDLRGETESEIRAAHFKI